MSVLQFKKYLMKMQRHENNIAQSEFESKHYPAGQSEIHREVVEWRGLLNYYYKVPASIV